MVTVHGSLISYYDVKTDINISFFSKMKQIKWKRRKPWNEFINSHSSKPMTYACIYVKTFLQTVRSATRRHTYFAFSTKHKHNTLCKYSLKLVSGNPHVQHACRISQRYGIHLKLFNEIEMSCIKKSCVRFKNIFNWAKKRIFRIFKALEMLMVWRQVDG